MVLHQEGGSWKLKGLTKILILRLQPPGYVVLATPLIRILKTQLDSAEIHFGTSEEGKTVLQANPYLDGIHVLTKDNKGITQKIKRLQFDLIIDLENNLQTFQLKQSIGGNWRRTPNLVFRQWAMVNFKVNWLPNQHVVDRFVSLVEDLGVKMDNLGLDYFIPHKDEVEEQWLPETHRQEYIAFALSANSPTQRMTVDKMIEVCDKINKPIILVGNKDDQAVANEVEHFFERRKSNKGYEKGLKELNKKTRIYNACGKFNSNQSASLIKRARALFCYDSEWMHIGAAFGKEIFSIWGSSIPEFGAYPFRTKFSIFQNTGINCRPCSMDGRKDCPVKHFKCMNEQTLDFYIP